MWGALIGYGWDMVMDGTGWDLAVLRMIPPPHNAYSRTGGTTYFIAGASGFLCLLARISQFVNMFYFLPQQFVVSITEPNRFSFMSSPFGTVVCLFPGLSIAIFK